MRKLVTELRQTLNLLGKGKWPYMIALLICALVEPVYQITFALVNKRLLNAIEFGDNGMFFNSLLLMAGVLLFYFIVQPITAYHYEGRLYYPIIDFKLRLLRQIIRVPLAWLESRHSGDLLTRVSQDVDDLDDFFRMHTYDIVSTTLWGAGSIASMFLISPVMATIMIALGALTAWGNTAYTQQLERQAENERHALVKANKKLADIIPGIRVIKSFNMETQFFQDFEQINDDWAQHSMAKSWTEASRAAISFTLSNLSFLGGLVAAAFMVASGSLDFGSALAVILLQNGVIAMFSQTGKYYSHIRESMVGVRRILDILEQPEEQGGICTLSLDSENAIQFQDVSFTYPGGKTVLSRFDLSLKKGGNGILAGPSGGGKSTIVKLLLGLYRPSKGRILVNGTDISTLSLQDLRNQFAYVAQDVFLFPDTIAENIRLGRPKASDSEVVAAAKKAWAHEFISTLPDGYQTRIGEGGKGLSGGQRQRLAIARAILKDAPILLLDEATSALDSETEQEIYTALTELAKDKTVLSVAHREVVLARAENVFEIQPSA